MNTIAVFVACLAVASAATVYRVPSQDSAVIESHRLGGAFSYSATEGHAVGVVSPVVQNVATPVATTYTTGNVALLNNQLQNVAVLNNQQQLQNVVSPVATTYTTGNVALLNNQHQLGNVVYTNQHQLGNVAVVRSGNLINGVQQVQLSNLHNVGVLPVSSVVY